MNVTARLFWVLITFRWAEFRQFLKTEQDKRVDSSGVHSDYSGYDFGFVVFWHVAMVCFFGLGISLCTTL